MTPELVRTLIEAVFALAALAVIVVQGAQHGRQQRLLIAQCDERVSMLLSNAERTTSRLVAISWPEGHKNYRNHSGTIDGARASIKVHGERATPSMEMLDRKIEQAAEAEQRAQRAKEEMMHTANAMRGENIPVATQLDFDSEGTNGVVR